MPLSDVDYADRLVAAARQIYTFAKNNRGKYSDVISDAAKFYKYVLKC